MGNFNKYQDRLAYEPQYISSLDLALLKRSCHALVLKSNHYDPNSAPAELSPSPSASPSLLASPAEPVSPFTDPTTVDSHVTSPGRCISRKATFVKENGTETPAAVEECATYAAPDKTHIPDPIFTTFDFGFGSTSVVGGVSVIGKPVLVSVNRQRPTLPATIRDVQEKQERPRTAGAILERRNTERRLELFPDMTPVLPPKTFEEIMDWTMSPKTAQFKQTDRPLPPVPAGILQYENKEMKKQKMKSGINAGWKGVTKKVGHLSSFMKSWKTK